VGNIDLEVISAAENSNKFQKTTFWKEKSVENVVTLGPTAQATTLVNMKQPKASSIDSPSTHIMYNPDIVSIWIMQTS
jgi:hypothetical protein